MDSTAITLPDAFASLYPGSHPDTAAVKVQVRWEMLTGAIDGLELQAERRNDRASTLHRKPLASGALRIADLGYFCLNRLEELSQADGFWLTRIQVGTKLHAFDRLWELPDFLKRHGPAQPGQSASIRVELGAHRRLPCHFLMIRLPQSVADDRIRRMEARAKNKGKQLSRHQRFLAQWTILATNAKLTPKEGEVLMRLRWQIERLFRLWKEQGKLDESRSRNPERVLCEFYAKLLALLIQHWVLIAGAWRVPDRSLTQVASFFRSMARHLAWVFDSVEHIRELLELIQDYAQHGGRLNKRRKRPNHCQLLMSVA